MDQTLAFSRRSGINEYSKEGVALHDLAADGDPNHLTRVQRVGAAQVIQSPLSTVNCPSRRPLGLYPLRTNEWGNLGFYNSTTPDAAGRSDYAANAGHVYCEWPYAILGRGPASYQEAKLWAANRVWGSEQPRLRVATPARIEALSGISFERSTVRVSQVVDGLSKTYLLGERYIPQNEYLSGRSLGDNETWCTGFNNDNYRKTGRLENGEIQECSPVPDWTNDVEDKNYRFGSAHPAGWSVAFCDGSVHTFQYEIDWRIHRDFGNRADGGVVQIPQY